MQGQSFAPRQRASAPPPFLARLCQRCCEHLRSSVSVAALLSAGLSIFGPAAQLMIAAIDLPTFLFGVLLGFGPGQRAHNGRATLTTRAVPKPPPIATPRRVSSPLPRFSPHLACFLACSLAVAYVKCVSRGACVQPASLRTLCLPQHALLGAVPCVVPCQLGARPPPDPSHNGQPRDLEPGVCRAFVASIDSALDRAPCIPANIVSSICEIPR